MGKLEDEDEMGCGRRKQGELGFMIGLGHLTLINWMIKKSTVNQSYLQVKTCSFMQSYNLFCCNVIGNFEMKKDFEWYL